MSGEMEESTDPATVKEEESHDTKDEASTEQTDDQVPQEKRIRRRKKGLHNAIRKQMEFYFSDANLTKDRFMQKITSDSDDVDLEVFMKFNKIRAISEDLQEIIKALKKSTFLKLSEDESKVSRITPFIPKPQEEIDNCTIYVEGIPQAATIEWVTSTFMEFGNIAYVSLPKYRDGSRNKGFAFVEFIDEESAIRAVEAYRNTCCYLAYENDPAKLCSIQAFNLENEQQKEKPKRSKTEESTAEKPADEESQQAGDDKENSESEPQNKKIKLEEPQTVSESLNEEDSGQQNVETEKKSKRKRKRKSGIRDEHIHHEAETLSLQVMSKKDWKRLRNKYLTMQRKCHKQKIMSLRNQQTEYHQKRCTEQQVEPMVEETEDKEDPAPMDPLLSGVIVKIILEEPVSDAKRFKGQVRSRPEVQYIEAEDFAQVAFVRCTDADAAKRLVEQKIWIQTEILQGDEEREYWRKIEEGRNKKRQTQTRQRTRKMGKAKSADESKPEAPSSRPLIQGKGKHIRFDDADDEEA